MRFALKTVEQKDAGIFGQAQAGSDFGEQGFGALVFIVDFFVELRGFGDGGGGGAVAFEFVGGGPVDELGGEFLPVIALGAEIADAVAFDFIFGDELIGAVFEDEAAGELLGGGVVGEEEQ